METELWAAALAGDPLAVMAWADWCEERGEPNNLKTRQARRPHTQELPNGTWQISLASGVGKRLRSRGHVTETAALWAARSMV